MRKSRSKSLRRALYWTFDRIGLNALFRHQNRNLVRIFTIHGVADYDRPHGWTPLRRQLDRGLLRRHLATLSSHYQFLSMDEAVEIISGRQEPRSNAVVLGFDDGYLNNFTEALPILKEFDAVGVFYIATGFVESRRPFWFDRLDYALQVAAKCGVEFELGGKTFSFKSDDRRDIADRYSELRAHCKTHFSDDDEFTKALDNVASQLEETTGMSLSTTLEGDHWAEVVTSDGIHDFARDAHVIFGSHTDNHIRIRFVESDVIIRELDDSKRKLELWSGVECKHFAYPNGEFDERSARLVQMAGHQSAVTTVFGMNSVGADLYALSRLNLPEDCTKSELRARASGLEVSITRLTSVLKGWLGCNSG